MTDRPELTVIVVTHNRGDLAVATLRRARAAAAGLAVQWLVIDSGSSDDTVAVLRRALPDITVHRSANIGFAAANNALLRAAEGRYVLLLNPDVEIESGSLAALIDELDARPRVGVASVLSRGTSGELQLTMRRFPTPGRALGEALHLSAARWGEEVPASMGYEREQSADWLVGAFLIARREVIDRVGGFDERFFLYSEETDWCYRVRAAGWDIRHLPTMVITHHSGLSTAPQLMAQLSYAKVLFARKHYGRARAEAIRSALMLRHLLRVVGLPLSRRAGATSRAGAERHALAVLRGRRPAPFAPPRVRSSPG